MLRLRPVDSVFFELLTTMAQHLVVGSSILAELLADDVDRGAVADRMREAEHRADETTHEIASRVSRRFVTPFDRDDIHALVTALDDVMDDMEEAVDLVHLHDVGPLPAGAAELVEVLQRCAELTAESMPRLRSMKDLEEYWIEINRLQNVGDRSFRGILALLLNGSYDALEALKVKGVVEALDSAVDGFERVADIVEQIHAKS